MTESYPSFSPAMAHQSEIGPNDYSNPQQGPDAHSPRSIKGPLVIPPTVKDGRKLFVGGLPADITNEEFRAFFEQFGVLIDSVVMHDHETNRSRGFGFVSFEDPLVANMLLAEGNGGVERSHGSGPASGHMEMRGKTIEIKPAEPKEGAYRKNRNHRKQFANNNYSEGNYEYGAAFAPYYGMHPIMAYPPSLAAQPYNGLVSLSPMHAGPPYETGVMYPSYPFYVTPSYYTDGASSHGSSSVSPRI